MIPGEFGSLDSVFVHTKPRSDSKHTDWNNQFGVNVWIDRITDSGLITRSANWSYTVRPNPNMQLNSHSIYNNSIQLYSIRRVERISILCLSETDRTKSRRSAPSVFLDAEDYTRSTIMKKRPDRIHTPTGSITHNV